MHHIYIIQCTKIFITVLKYLNKYTIKISNKF